MAADPELVPDAETAGSEASLLESLRALEQQVVQAAAANPVEALSLLVLGGATLLYWAEAGRNEKIRSWGDAVHYVATSASVGYSNMFPETPVGKAIGSLVMMVGPSLAANLLRAPEPVAAPLPASDSGEIAGKLDAILAELKRIGAGQ